MLKLNVPWKKITVTGLPFHTLPSIPIDPFTRVKEMREYNHPLIQGGWYKKTPLTNDISMQTYVSPGGNYKR